MHVFEKLGLTYVVLIVAGAVGWIMNLAAVYGADFSHVTGQLVLRMIGVPVVFVGAVLGYF